MVKILEATPLAFVFLYSKTPTLFLVVLVSSSGKSGICSFIKSFPAFKMCLTDLPKEKHTHTQTAYQYIFLNNAHRIEEYIEKEIQ